MRVAVPFNTPVYAHVNGGHPLLAQLVANANGLDFAPAVAGNPALHDLVGSLGDAAALAARLAQPAPGAIAPAPPDRQTLLDYLHSRDPGSQALVPRDADLAFLHTVPLTYSATPWLLHLENVTTLFWPFLHQGSLRDRRLYAEPAFAVVERVLADPQCRILFTHCRRTVEQMERIFGTEAIGRKIRYAPLGVHVPAVWQTRIEEALASKHTTGGRVEILFTNSWHQAPENFLNRGGLEVVQAFVELHRAYPEAHLTIRSALPREIGDPAIARALAGHPAITLLDRPIDDEALNALLLAADIFLLPSASLHSVSVLRAMSFGAVPVVSDLPVLGEFVEDGRTGVAIPGRHAKVCTVDPESGWEQEDYAAMRRLDREVADALTGALLALCREPARRRAIALEARRASQTAFSFDRFLGAFESALADAAEPPASRPAAAAPPAPDATVAGDLARRMAGEFALFRHPLAEVPLMTDQYRGFDIVWHRGRVYGVRHGAAGSSGGIDLSVGPEALRAGFPPEDLVIGDTTEQVFARIDAVEAQRAVATLAERLAAVARRVGLTGGDPLAVQPAGEHRGFSLFWHDDRVFALRQGVEGIDPTAPEEVLQPHAANGDLLTADTVDAARLEIDRRFADRAMEALTARVDSTTGALAARLDTAAGRIDVLAYGPAGDPLAVQPAGEHRGFNLIRHGGRVLALRQGVEGIDPAGPEDTLRQHAARGDLLVADGVDTARLLIDRHILEREAAALTERVATLQRRVDVLAHGPAGDPAAVHPLGEHRGFNLFWHGGRVLAVRQTAGAVDPSAGEAALRGRLAPDDLVIADGRDTARLRIDLIEAERARLFNRLLRKS